MRKHVLLASIFTGALMLMGNLCAQPAQPSQPTQSAPSPWDMTPSQVRAMMNAKFLAIPAETPEVGEVKNITINTAGRTTPLRIYTPNKPHNKELPIILYIHGGAWIAGNLETHDHLARYLCRGVQALVVSVDYLNAPEGKFPFSLEQCNDALHWITAHAEEFHANPHKGLAVVGDSAGGNMAAALCFLERNQNGPHIDFQVLINPVINNHWGETLQRQNDELDTERWYATQYVTNPQETQNPYVSLNFAKDLTHLPPALILLGEKDLFRKDAQGYADRLRAAEIPTNVYIQWGVGHLGGEGGRASQLAQESLDVAVAALRGAFYRKTH